MLIYGTFYHVTDQRNFDSIMEVGVSPAYSRGRLSVVWMTDYERIPWALAHLSEREDLSVSRMVVLTLQAPTVEVRRTRWTGVYQCRTALYPTNAETASQYLHQLEAEMQVRKKAVKL